jgi:hypothetical protein
LSVAKLLTVQTVPEFVRRAFFKADAPVNPEQKLMRDVLARAVLDAVGYTSLTDATAHLRVMTEAVEWFIGAENVEWLVELADVDLPDIRTNVLSIA